jgi:hypothetical protein
MSQCLVCRSQQIETLLELGTQPISSHFTRTSDTRVVEHDLALAVCKACGVVQLARPFPFPDLVPPYEWMTYRESEAHLDAVVDRICHLPGLNKRSAIAGITFKDSTSLEQMRTGTRSPD